jgi:hypothetical protein
MYKLAKLSAAGFAYLCIPTALAAPNAMEGSASMSTSPPLGAARVASYAAASGAVESVFFHEDLGASGSRLTGLTHVGEGMRVWEEARFDHAGRLVHAESVCSSPSGTSLAVTFEPCAGEVETRDAQGVHRWSVPNDYAWVWRPSGCGDDTEAGSITTPVASVVAARASKRHSVLRMIDTHKFSGHTITVDQVMVPEDAKSSWVVLGDDAVLVDDEAPVRWHANVFHADVERR